MKMFIAPTKSTPPLVMTWGKELLVERDIIHNFGAAGSGNIERSGPPAVLLCSR